MTSLGRRQYLVKRDLILTICFKAVGYGLVTRPVTLNMSPAATPTPRTETLEG
jgi:hypothetical protein